MAWQDFFNPDGTIRWRDFAEDVAHVELCFRMGTCKRCRDSEVDEGPAGYKWGLCMKCWEEQSARTPGFFSSNMRSDNPLKNTCSFCGGPWETTIPGVPWIKAHAEESFSTTWPVAVRSCARCYGKEPPTLDELKGEGESDE